MPPCSSQPPADPTRAPAQLHPGVWLATGAKQQSWGFPLVLLILVYRPHTTRQQRPSRPLEVVTTQFFSQSDAFSGCMWGGIALPELRITYRGGRGCRCCQQRGAWGWLIIRVTSSHLQPAEKLHRSPGREENRRSTEEELQPQGTHVRADRGSTRPRDGSANAMCPWELRAGVWAVLRSQGRLCPRGMSWERVGSVPE